MAVKELTLHSLRVIDVPSFQEGGMDGQAALRCTAKIASSYARSHAMSSEELVAMIALVHGAVARLGDQDNRAAPPLPSPAHRHVTPDYIVSLESGRRLKTLRRYLMATHGLTPEAYRAKWGLPADYPMVAPNYSLKRRDIAVANGLGKSPPR